jgi:hypothetical protein
MTKSQTIMWTALPTGYTAGRSGKLRLSIFVSPRLETSAPMGVLGEFPDFASGVALQNWASVVATMSFDVEMWNGKITGTKHRHHATVVSEPPEPDLWDRFFGTEMPIKQFKFVDLSSTVIKTFSAKGVHNTLKNQYRAVAAAPRLAYKIPDVMDLVNPPGIKNPPLAEVLPTDMMSSRPGMAAMAAVKVQNPTWTKFEDFHRPWEVPSTFVAPPIPPIDFHKACTALGNYPALMRRLGLVLDIEVPFAASMRGATRVRIRPTWADGRPSQGGTVPASAGSVAHTDASQWTAVTLSAKPGKSGTSLAGFKTASRDGQLKDGYLVVRAAKLEKDPAALFNVDVDLAAARFLATAVQVAELVESRVNPPVNANATPGKGVASTTAAAANVSEQIGLPALGQPVIRLSVAGAAERISRQMDIFKGMNDRLVAGEEDASVNYAEDLNRGYRIDVWDDVTRQWHKLCARVGSYAIGDTAITWSGQPTLTDEGWIQLSATSAPENVNTDDPPSEMRIHESLFDWSGWSLAVPRPGAALTEPDEHQNTTTTKTFVGPDGLEHPLGGYLHPNLPLATGFAVPPGSLPRLRFGMTYRFRARAVDLAGNSVAFSPGSITSDPGGTNDANTLVSRAITHKRYDPVKPPDVVMAESPKPSETPNVVVVRTYTSPSSGFLVTEGAIRHITPPRIAVSMAEALGGLDSTATGKPMDKALYDELCARDAWDAPMDADHNQIPQPTIPSPVRYLPDKFSRGASFANLPGVQNKVVTKKLGGGARISGVKIPLGGTKSATVATTRVGFEPTTGSPWYDKLPFDVSVAGIGPLDTRIDDSDLPDAPVWNETQRVLAVELPKAEELTVGLSSFAFGADLTYMGVYQWGLEPFIPALIVTKTPKIPKIKAVAAAATATPTALKANKIPVAAKPSLGAIPNAVINATLIGQNWMLTPQRDLTFVHAVDKPLITPTFTSRAHYERISGSKTAYLIDWMPVHGKSTSKVEVKAKWTENVDDPASGVPLWGATAVKKAAHVFSLTLEKDAETALNAGTKPPAMVTVPWGVEPAYGPLIDVDEMDVGGFAHHFEDTKHRYVEVNTISTSRFDKYFADIRGIDCTVTSIGKKLHVPSSVAPSKPDVQYIIPTFGWTRSGTTSARTGGGLRVYLGRPWFSSGDAERLAVVMWTNKPGYAGLDKVKDYVSYWGRDPLYVSKALPNQAIAATNFKKTATKAYNLHVGGHLDVPIEIAAYDVDYDSETDMWFADIVIDQGKAYLPFVKLALARYQAYSLEGLELSPISVADFVQLTPDRSATASLSTPAIIGGNPTRTAAVSLTGQTYSKNYPNQAAVVTSTIERSFGTVDPYAGWTAITDEVELAMQPLSAIDVLLGKTSTTWSGNISFTDVQDGAQHRVVIREYEMFARYQSSAQRRLVFAESIPLST